MQQGQRQETRVVQRQVLGLTARQTLELVVMSASELAEVLDRTARENPFVVCRAPVVQQARMSAEPEAGGDSLFSHVLAAIPLLVSSTADRAVAFRLAEALDETGLLVEDTGAIATELGLPRARVETVLTCLQQIEPVGLFARSVKECLALQLRARNLLDATAVTLLCHLDSLPATGIAAFARRHALDADRVQALLAVIARLTRNPGAAFGGRGASAVWPDLAFSRTQDGWTVATCAEVLPRVTLRPAAFERALAQAPDAETRSLVRRRWQEARNLHRMLAQREDTLLRLGGILVQDQRRGLDSGFHCLAPLTQREVAARLSVHSSTVCRMVRHRMALVEGQMVPLARFFERPHRAAAAQGLTRSAILAALTQRVASEPKADPFSDEDLARFLSENGMQASRRQVSKYRALLNIPAAHRRSGLAACRPGCS